MANTVPTVVDCPTVLTRYIRGFRSGMVQSLVVIGRGGTGKSSLVREHFSKEMAGWKVGRISAIKFYLHLYGNVDRPIILDDAPNIARDLALAGLLRQLCETRPVKTVSWDTQSRLLKDIPTEFETRSRLILITNKWMDSHPEVEALETRCSLIRYEPSVESLHERARDMSGVERVVWDYVGAAIREGRVHRVNLRDYILATEDYRIGVDWKGPLEAKFLPDDIEDLDSDREVILAWARRWPRKTFALRDLLMGPSRFRGGHADHVRRLLTEMVEDGVLVEHAPEGRGRGRGRPPASRYSLRTQCRPKPSVN
ncbi:hypothetical protein AB1L88_19690 [Tautonia sp. JC769]|uniref:hypothetical protein n=1 Tax=Tautonia sp. JC769 TaxID=3232135 RepID=UPI00345942F7